MIKTLLVTALFAVVNFSSSLAKEVKIGDLLIEQPTVRATTPGAKVAGGYLTITNTGDTSDRLIGGNASFSGKLEVHQMRMDNDVMKMSEIDGGLDLPSGATVKLVPGGYHLMLMKLGEQMVEGDKRMITLQFEKAGPADIEFHVKSIADTMKMKKKHSH